jgi:hypothetical protein
MSVKTSGSALVSMQIRIQRLDDSKKFIDSFILFQKLQYIYPNAFMKDVQATG